MSIVPESGKNGQWEDKAIYCNHLPRFYFCSAEIGVNAESARHFPKWPVLCPEKGWRIDEDRGDEFGVDQAYAKAVQTTRLDHEAHLVELRHFQLRQAIEQRKRPGTLPQGSERKFGDDERMDDDAALAEIETHLIVFGTEVVDPNRGIGKNHCELVRPRGTLGRRGGWRIGLSGRWTRCIISENNQEPGNVRIALAAIVIKIKQERPQPGNVEASY